MLKTLEAQAVSVIFPAISQQALAYRGLFCAHWLKGDRESGQDEWLSVPLSLSQSKELQCSLATPVSPWLVLESPLLSVRIQLALTENTREKEAPTFSIHSQKASLHLSSLMPIYQRTPTETSFAVILRTLMGLSFCYFI